MDVSKIYSNLLTNYQNEVGKVFSGAQLPGDSGTPTSLSKNEFSGILDQAIEKVNGSIATSNQDVQSLVTGDLGDLHTLMIDTTEAQLSLQLAVQVRNKCIEAYNEVKNMQF